MANCGDSGSVLLCRDERHLHLRQGRLRKGILPVLLRLRMPLRLWQTGLPLRRGRGNSSRVFRAKRTGDRHTFSTVIGCPSRSSSSSQNSDPQPFHCGDDNADEDDHDRPRRRRSRAFHGCSGNRRTSQFRPASRGLSRFAFASSTRAVDNARIASTGWSNAKFSRVSARSSGNVL